jgi:hypothetical protein
MGLRASTRWVDCKVAFHDTSFDPRIRAPGDSSETVIGVFWHEYLALPIALWSGIPVTMLVSQHRDAEWLTQAAEWLGFSVVRGSTRRGGTRAIRQLRQVCQTNSLGITPDGPLGPRRKMTLGPVFLAALTQMPILPVGVGYRRPWRLGTWDRFAIAKPFSRARAIAGPKFRLPPNARRDDLEDFRGQIESLLAELTAQAEDWANATYDLRGQYSLRGGQLILDEDAQPTSSAAPLRSAA